MIRLQFETIREHLREVEDTYIDRCGDINEWELNLFLDKLRLMLRDRVHKYWDMYNPNPDFE